MAPIIRPTAVKLMKLGMSDSYMKRMPAAVSRLRIADSAVSTLWVSGLMRSNVTAVPTTPRMAERTMTMAIRMRKMTTGWGTMLPTRSTTSRNLCMAVLGAGAA
jgi:hypothetical protein